MERDLKKIVMLLTICFLPHFLKAEEWTSYIRFYQELTPEEILDQQIFELAPLAPIFMLDEEKAYLKLDWLDYVEELDPDHVVLYFTHHDGAIYDRKDLSPLPRIHFDRKGLYLHYDDLYGKDNDELLLTLREAFLQVSDNPVIEALIEQGKNKEDQILYELGDGKVFPVSTPLSMDPQTNAEGVTTLNPNILGSDWKQIHFLSKSPLSEEELNRYASQSLGYSETLPFTWDPDPNRTFGAFQEDGYRFIALYVPRKLRANRTVHYLLVSYSKDPNYE